MISIKVDVSGIDQTIRHLQGLAKQVEFAKVKALSDTARDAAADVQAAMPRYIDKPVPFTVRSIRWKRATTAVPQSAVYIAPIAAAYLGPLIAGGVERPTKGRNLVLAGADPIDPFGNVPRRRVKQLLRQPNTFAGTVKGVQGIWQRVSAGHVRLLLRFEPEQKKRPTFPFPRLVAESVRRNWQRNFDAAFAYAMRTAR